jgi:hypothetical protein
MVIARNPERGVDLLILHRRLEHHPFGQLSDDAALNFLPRCLTHQVLVAASCLKTGAADTELLVGHQNVGRAFLQVDAQALRIAGEPEVPDGRPSPMQASAVMPFFSR